MSAAIKKDLNLTTAQVANSNIVSICATWVNTPPPTLNLLSSNLKSNKPSVYSSHGF